jgi:uncharacterized membrane protein YkoI
VIDSVLATYPGYYIEPGNIERFEYPDGTVEYEIEVTGQNDSDFDLQVDAQGTILCEKPS